MKRVLLVALLPLAVACASNPSSSMNMSTSRAVDSSSASLSRSRASHYILLSQPTAIREIDWSRRVYDLHVKGHVTNRGFMPSGTVEGKGRLCPEGTDWLRLSDMKIHSAQDGTPQAPYILGCRTASGFVPASRDVVM
ncbi:MAG TPA: hypothetical protein VNM92_01840 [Thermoanaerobaculia bacterium]|nr:hypothetical protein [Thermoanaerobaculia bacterium]